MHRQVDRRGQALAQTVTADRNGEVVRGGCDHPARRDEELHTQSGNEQQGDKPRLPCHCYAYSIHHAILPDIWTIASESGPGSGNFCEITQKIRANPGHGNAVAKWLLLQIS